VVYRPNHILSLNNMFGCNHHPMAFVINAVIITDKIQKINEMILEKINLMGGQITRPKNRGGYITAFHLDSSFKIKRWSIRCFPSLSVNSNGSINPSCSKIVKIWYAMMRSKPKVSVSTFSLVRSLYDQSAERCFRSKSQRAASAVCLWNIHSWIKERPMRPNDPKLSHGHGNNAKDVR
jgi:hypothetical protein